MRQKLIPCFVAAALVFTGAVGANLLTADPTFAGKATPATDKNTNVPAVPRAIPNLIPYHKFDPPKAKDLASSVASYQVQLEVQLTDYVDSTPKLELPFIVNITA